MSQTHAVGGFIRTSRQVVNFIEAFADDLRFVGLRPRISVRKDALKLVCPTHEFNPSEYAKIGDKIRSRRLWDQREAIRAFETSSLRLLFVDGNEIDPQHIRPKVEVCRTDAEFATHRYCRLQQSVPSGPRVGRRIAALIYDVGQNRRALMGAIMLASPLYSVRARDAFLGWANRKLVKDAGLKRTMDLSLCMALPPYNELLAGKLMATLAVSSTMSKEFSTRYDDHLLAVTTTSATGLHCPIFNRIMIRPGGLYRRIGETTGYTTMILGDLTLHAARELIKVHRLARNQDITLWNTIRLIKTALRYCGINPEPFLRVGNHKGVYIALLDPRSRDRLESGDTVVRRRMISDDDAIAFWKSQILPRRFSEPETLRKIRTHKFRTLEIRHQVA